MNDKQELSKKEVDELIDHKITKAKLEIEERRLHFTLWLGGALIAVFGVMLPLMQNSISSREISSAIEKTERESAEASAEVSAAIEKMERQFDKLAGKQILTPEVACFADGTPLEKLTLVFSKKNSSHDFSIRNIGNDVATLIRVRLYLNVESEISKKHFCGNNSGDFWYYAELNDKPEYKCMLQLVSYGREDFIAPADKMSFYLSLDKPAELSNTIESPALLVIYYGASEPKEIPFTLRLEGSSIPKATP